MDREQAVLAEQSAELQGGGEEREEVNKRQRSLKNKACQPVRRGSFSHNRMLPLPELFRLTLSLSRATMISLVRLLNVHPKEGRCVKER